MVSNKFLGALAAKLEFHKHLQHFSNPIQTNIASYIEDIEVAAEESGGARDYWLGTKDAPKVRSVEVFGKIGFNSNDIVNLVSSGYDRGIHRCHVC